MKRLRFAAIVTGGLVGFMGVLVACSSDDTIVTSPDGGDGGPQQTETGSPDVQMEDVRNDVISDPDAGFKPDAAQQQIAEVICETVARCCFGNAMLEAGAPIGGGDGGTFNKAKCLDLYRENGFEQSSPGPSAAVGRIQLSQTASADCAQKLKGLSCEVGFAEFQAVRTACYASQVGTQPLNGPCNVTGECVTGAFCNKPDGGTCEAIRVDGGCGDFTDDPALAQHACSNRYSGAPARYCEFYDFLIDDSLPRAQWACKEARGNGEPCASSAWCNAGVCSSETFRCTSPVTYFPPTFCADYKQ